MLRSRRKLSTLHFINFKFSRSKVDNFACPQKQMTGVTVRPGWAVVPRKAPSLMDN